MSTKKKATTTTATPKSKVKVLYQYLNGTWYAFADLGSEIFFGKVPVPAKAKGGRGQSSKRKNSAKKAPSKSA